MARIILKTSLANTTFSVESKSIEVTRGASTTPSPIELLISPNSGFAIDSNNFTSGGLPSQISRILYRNTQAIIDTNNKVVATVYFNQLSVYSESESIFLPISGSSVITSNEIILTESSPVDENSIVIYSNQNNKQTSTSTGSINRNNYSIKGSPGQSVNIFSKTISVPSGYYFSQEPKATSNSELTKYKIDSTVNKDEDGNIISKTFNVSAIFPSSPLRKNYNDNISFTYRSSKLKDTYGKLLREDKLEKTIYDIDTGNTIGSGGGVKRIAVKGVPGTPFKVIISNANKQSYNFKTGSFEDGGFLLEGIIPPVKAGVGYGVYNASIEVPPSTSGNTISTTLISNNPVDHEALKNKYDVGVIGDGGYRDANTSSEVKADGTIRFLLHNGGETAFFITKPITDGDLFTADTLYEHEGISYFISGFYDVGPNDYGSSVTGYLSERPFKISNLSGGGTSNTLSFLITTDAENKFIRINRQPVFNQDKEFVAWDSAFGADDTKSFNSEGVSILTDIVDGADGTSTLDFKGAKLQIGAVIDPIGVGVKHDVSDAEDLLAYKFMRITISVTGTFGEGSIKPALNLKNFLSIYTL